MRYVGASAVSFFQTENLWTLKTSQKSTLARGTETYEFNFARRQILPKEKEGPSHDSDITEAHRAAAGGGKGGLLASEAQDRRLGLMRSNSSRDQK